MILHKASSPSGKLAFIDSGAPPNTESYKTIIAVHGVMFTYEVFQKCVDLAPEKGIRFVTVSRRGYPGSPALDSSSDDPAKKFELLGSDLLHFLDSFVEEHNIPTENGVVLLAWSFGAAHVMGAISQRCPSYIKSIVLYDPPLPVFGAALPEHSKTASAMQDPSPDNLRAHAQWLSAYFAHPHFACSAGASASERHRKLEWIAPSPSRQPSFPSEPDSKGLLSLDNFLQDASLLAATDVLQKNFHSLVQKAADGVVEVVCVGGTMSVADCVAGMWLVQDWVEERGLNSAVRIVWLTGANHFVHWDDPSTALEAFI
ncbi:alpha/beta-hydrolase [Cylindrobasidium torrendii FP15055 ss-10]|uniref:Alpha/beta-hydrolase n=1 Tax=Cylindrobasidium torrendii FP15055 ss-10 TaxID=1314674 RepID=A0A0D7BDB5_9AGAR|nr:alpha/beta-hydrolase [Cylindrobasidium torrendii FP15055 ss-10]